MSEIQPIRPADEPGRVEPQKQDDLAGYPDAAALVKGYRASGDEAKRQRERAERAETLLAQVHADMQRRPEIPQRPSQSLDDYGIPTPLLDEYFDRRFQQAMGPVAKSFEARNSLLGEYGDDYQKFESDVMRFVGSDARLQQRYNDWWKHDPEGAMEWAFLKFGESRRKQGTTEPNGEIRQMRAEATVPAGTGSPQRGGPAISQRELWDQYLKDGDAEAYARARLRSLKSVQQQTQAASQW